MVYVGRFAPTPSGPLHFGSLVTALASWLDARHHQGRWLLRIEDLDPPREEPGASERILRTLEALGLTWDGPVIYQSQRSEAYAQALDQLQQKGEVYPCSCTRKELQGSRIYPGYCRQGPCHPDQPLAWRLAVDPQLTATWTDRIQGFQQWPLQAAGDVVVKRKDGLWAYQLAVTVDDLAFDVTHLVRGIDLLDSTPWQMNLLRYLAPDAADFDYAHLPVIVNAEGQKLSKQNLAPALDTRQSSELIYRALVALNQPVPPECRQLPCEELLDLAVRHWQAEAIPGKTHIYEESLPPCTSTASSWS
ncbi:tRNA glutamyl-Q(34) synthetase GluQRS [Marinospirillum perlucidum]|uniref:tRNA glutamyl-Q(34) synthetase GluQRS n=1 Tax=Marinospirillum perlucidum TaxID=1982602 RepID=UPI000DF2DC72|nr:tRNA glutamyl-Q(34) synthetase GluQRS [Marinospirillum perlucidum]